MPRTRNQSAAQPAAVAAVPQVAAAVPLEPHKMETRGRQSKRPSSMPPGGNAAPPAPAASGGTRRRGLGAARKSPSFLPHAPPPPPPAPHQREATLSQRRRPRSQRADGTRRVRVRLDEQEKRGVIEKGSNEIPDDLNTREEIDRSWEDMNGVKQGVDNILNAIQSQQHPPTPAAGGSHADAPGDLISFDLGTDLSPEI